MIVGAFALNTFEITKTESPTYLLFNLLGSLAIIVSSAYKKDYQPVALNTVWAIIAAFGFLRVIM